MKKLLKNLKIYFFLLNLELARVGTGGCKKNGAGAGKKQTGSATLLVSANVFGCSLTVLSTVRVTWMLLIHNVLEI